MSDQGASPAGSPLADALSEQLAEQQERIRILQAQSGSPEHDLEESLLEISVAHEELRVAQEELRAQQQAIDDLLVREVAAKLPIKLHLIKVAPRSRAHVCAQRPEFPAELLIRSGGLFQIIGNARSASGEP